MITQYKIRDINRNPNLHKEVFVKASECMEVLESFIDSAVNAGADKEKLMELISNEEVS